PNSNPISRRSSVLEQATLRAKYSFLGALVCPRPLLVCLPLHIDQVRVKRVRFFLCHPGVDPRPARRSDVFRHAVLLVAAPQDNRVEALMNTERHVAEIGRLAIKRPRAAPIRVRGVTLL